MRITPELLQKLARDQVAKSLHQYDDIIAVYLTGSVLVGEPLLGGSTDIDMVLVHKENPSVERDVARISHEISLDMVHHHQSFYAFPRRLRLNPWLGQALSTHASILYDTDHWMEYIQAGVGTQFGLPENIFGRALPMVEQARSIWFDLEDSQELALNIWFDQYFKAVGLSANGVAVLQGNGLTNRRFLVDFPARVEALGKPELHGLLLGLISAGRASNEFLTEWREPWESVLVAIGKEANCPVNLHPCRRSYFLAAYDALIESGSPYLALWTLLETWSMAIRTLGEIKPHQNAWLGFLADMGFNDKEKLRHVADLDAFLDEVEATLEGWKNNYGL
jgi:hypothetical protein